MKYNFIAPLMENFFATQKKFFIRVFRRSDLVLTDYSRKSTSEQTKWVLWKTAFKKYSQCGEEQN